MAEITGKITMKIYEFKYPGGETDWVFAPNKTEAKEFYLIFTQCGDLDDCTVKSVPKAKWDSHYILDTDCPQPPEGDYNESEYALGYKIQQTFAQYANENTETDIIATTEF